jgi:hypothetical protein
MDPIFTRLLNAITEQNRLLESIATKFEQYEGSGGGGGGNASIADYAENRLYKRNTLLVDANNETVYRVLPTEYLSVNLNADIAAGNLKLVGFENQVILTKDHELSQEEINDIPDNATVIIYNPADTPYTPTSQE